MRRRKNNLRSLHKGLLLLILAVVIIALVIYLQKAFEPEIEEFPTEVLFDLSVKIAILNGNGYPNVATEVKEYFLEQHEYPRQPLSLLSAEKKLLRVKLKLY